MPLINTVELGELELFLTLYHRYLNILTTTSS